MSCYREPSLGEDILHDRRQWNRSENDTVSGEKTYGGSTVGKEEGIDEQGEHIVVISERQQFVLFTRPGGNPLPASAIARELAKIRRMSRNRMGETVHAVGGASAGRRDRAAEFWEEMRKSRFGEKGRGGNRVN